MPVNFSPFDFIKDPAKRIAAAQQSLRKTSLGRGGVIRVDQDPLTGVPKYVLVATGKILDSPEEAFIAASTAMITQFQSLRAESGSVSNLANTTNNPKYAQVGEILQDIQKKLQNLTPDKQERLKSMGIDISSLGENFDVSANIIVNKTQRGSKSAEFIKTMAKEIKSNPSLGGFIPLVDDEGANLLQIKVGGKILSEAETYYMLNVIGNPIFPRRYICRYFYG